MMKMRTLSRLVGLVSIGLLAAYGLDQMLGGNRHKKWVVDTGESVDCAARLCSDGTLVAGNYHLVLALHGTSGTKKWSFTCPEASENLASAPAVGPDDTVYIPAQREGKPYRVFVLDGVSGRLKRVIDRPATALVPGEAHALFLGYRQVIAADEATGRLRWTFNPPRKAGDDLSNGDGHVEAMAYQPPTLYAVCGCPDSTLDALDANTGRRRWAVSLDRSGEFPCSVPASLAVTGDGTPIVSLLHASLCAYEARTGRVLWRLPPLGGFRPAQLQVGPGNMLYAGNDQGTLCALDARTGATIWERNLGAKISHPPVVSPNGVLYVGTNANQVYALDARTGQILWSVPLGGLSRDFIPGYGEDVSLTLGPEATVYAASSNGQVEALHAP